MSTVTRARGSRSSISSCELEHELGVALERLVVVVAHDQGDDGLLDRGDDARRVDEPLAPLGRLRRERVPGQRGDEVGGELDGVHELALRRPRMLSPPLDVHLQLPGRERLDLELADARPVEGVGGLGAERLDVEVVGAPPHLLVDRERDAHRRPRLGGATKIRDRRHDLRHAGLVVGSEERRAVTRDDVVADPRRERGLVGRDRGSGSDRRAARSARRRSPRARSGDAGARRLRRRVDVGDQADHGRARRAGKRRDHVAELVQLDVVEPDLSQLVGQDAREVELLRGARDTSRPPSSDCVSTRT